MRLLFRPVIEIGRAQEQNEVWEKRVRLSYRVNPGGY